MSEAINRRRALTVVASVPAAIALASTSLANGSGDAELLAHGERCKVLAAETKRLAKILATAVRKRNAALYASKPERWRCEFHDHAEITMVDDCWHVRAYDNSSSWFALNVDDAPEPSEEFPTKLFPLKARTDEGAKIEAHELDRKLRDEFWAKCQKAGEPFNRDAHYKAWSRSHTVLRRAVAQLARLKATTPQGLNMKALVLATAHDAFDDANIWNEPLQKSISRDIRRMAAA